MNKQKLAAWLGLAYRAGGVVTGEQACLAEMRKGRARLVLVAEDAGANRKKKYRDKSAYYRVPLVEALRKDELGRAVGKGERAVIVIVHPSFAENILLALREDIGGEMIE